MEEYGVWIPTSSRSFTVTNKSNSLTYTVASSFVCTSPLAVTIVVGLFVEEKFLSLDPISSATVRKVIYYLTSGKMKGRRKCWKIKIKRRKVKLMKKSRKSERTLNSCMRHGDDHGME